jgi:hypothetical protein
MSKDYKGLHDESLDTGVDSTRHNEVHKVGHDDSIAIETVEDSARNETFVV